MTEVVCTQTGLNPNRRTIVANYAWIVEMRNGQEMSNFWVDVSKCGLAQLDALRAELVANADHSNGSVTYPVSQHHLYFEDGGHARPRILYDMKQAEISYNNYYPERGAKVLSPTPEFWIQEGITENPNFVEPVV